MVHYAMENTGLRSRDCDTVRQASDVAFGVLPYGDTVMDAGLDPARTNELFDACLKPYFACRLFTLYLGDFFHVDGPQGLL